MSIRNMISAILGGPTLMALAGCGNSPTTSGSDTSGSPPGARLVRSLRAGASPVGSATIQYFAQFRKGHI